MHQSILIYRNFLFLKLALLAVVIAVVPYAVHSPLQGPDGGTWLGYTLGCVSAFLVGLLMWFGIRKRRFGPGTVNLQAWLSAHVYFGVALIVFATLHTGFQFGLNVHTLAYVLMIIVIASGMLGVYCYLRFPVAITENLRGDTLDRIMLQIADLDLQCREIAMGLGDEINTIVFEASRTSRVGGGLFRQLSGRDPGCPTTAALGRVEALADKSTAPDAERIRPLFGLLSRQCELLKRARSDVRFQAMMRIWLYIHVPFSFALLAALLAHVFAVFFYW